MQLEYEGLFQLQVGSQLELPALHHRAQVVQLRLERSVTEANTADPVTTKPFSLYPHQLINLFGRPLLLLNLGRVPISTSLMPNVRLDDVPDFIEEFLPTTRSTSLIRNRVARLGHRANAIEKALSLGKRADHKAITQAETDRRRAIRTLVFLLLIDNRNPVSMASSLKRRYEYMAFNVLLNLIKQNLPLLDNSPERVDWDPAHFTDVTVSGPARLIIAT